MRWLAAALSGLLSATAAAAQSTLLDLVLVGTDDQPLRRQDVALVAGDATGVGFPVTALRKPLLGRTDEAGRCVFAVPRFDQYWLRIGGAAAVHDAWPVLPDDRQQRLQIAAPGSIEVLDMSADARPAAAELRVLVRGLTPEAEAVVHRGRGDRLAIARLRRGDYVVAMAVEGHRYTQRTVTVREGATQRYAMYPADGLLAAGRVLDANGAPIAGARLFGSANSLLDVLTDADGRFDLGSCGGMAMHRVLLQAPGQAPQSLALMDLLAEALGDDGEVRPLELRLAVPPPLRRLRLRRSDRAPLVGLRAQQLQLGHRQLLHATQEAGEAWFVNHPDPAAPQGGQRPAAAPSDAAQILVLADGCALTGSATAADGELDLVPGVTRVLRLPAESAGPAGDGVRWLLLSQQGIRRRVPIGRDGRALVSHLAIAALEWHLEGGARGAIDLDELPFAELDLR